MILEMVIPTRREWEDRAVSRRIDSTAPRMIHFRISGQLRYAKRRVDNTTTSRTLAAYYCLDEKWWLRRSFKCWYSRLSIDKLLSKSYLIDTTIVTVCQCVNRMLCRLEWWEHACVPASRVRCSSSPKLCGIKMTFFNAVDLVHLVPLVHLVHLTYLIHF